MDVRTYCWFGVCGSSWAIYAETRYHSSKTHPLLCFDNPRLHGLPARRKDEIKFPDQTPRL